MANMTFKANLIPQTDLEYELGSNNPSLKRWKIYGDIQPSQSKTFTGVIGTANDWANTTFFFGSVKPTNFTDQWTIKYKVTAIAAGDDRAKATSILVLNGHADTYSSYAAWNAIYNTSYRPCQYHVYYRLKQAGFTNGYGHALGLRLLSAWNPITAANARTVTIDILETINCTFTFYNSMLKYASIPGTGSTNYTGYSEFDFANNGLQETGDSNTTEDGSIYISAKTGAVGIWTTGLAMEDGNGTYQSICTAQDGTVTSSNRTTGANKLPNPNGFKVGGTIWFTNGNYAANTNITGWLSMYNEYSTFDSRYSLNTTLTAGSLTPYAPIYLVGTIGNDGLYYLDSPWWTQTPITQGKVYVLLGGCYDSTTTNCRITLYQHNPWYYYDGTQLKAYWYNMYGNESAAQNGTKLSLVTTGEKYIWNNKGSVTKVTAGTGLSIGSTAGGNFTTSGTINHTNSVTAQPTRGLYPIEIDAQGHIAAYGSAVTSLPASDVPAWAKDASKPSYTASEVGAAASSHAHGQITSSGAITSTGVAFENNDRLLFSDNSDSSKIKRSSIVFDGSTATKALTQKGTWETFNNYSLPTAASGTLGGIKTGYTTSGTNYKVNVDGNGNAYVSVPWNNTDSTKLPLTGGTMTGSITVGNSNSIDLGSSSQAWNNIYANIIHGELDHYIDIGGKQFNGGDNIVIYASDLGVSSALHFIGVITETLEPREIVNPNNANEMIPNPNYPTTTPTVHTVTAPSVAVTPSDGYVVICESTQDEFLWSDGAWHSLGLASSFALHNHTHGELNNDGSIGANGGKIVVTKSNGAITVSSVSTPTPGSNDKGTAFIDSISTNTTTGAITITKKNLDTSGTWSGTAAKATADANGLNIASNYLKKTGDAMIGDLTVQKVIGTSTVTYGTTLPATGTTGQLFFQLGDDVYEIPAGGTTGQALIKNSNSDRDVTWGNVAGGSYVQKSGDTLDSTAQLSRVGINKSWWAGRDAAIIRQTSYSGYNAIISAKTTNGSWELGSYTNDFLYFCYVPDTSYNGSTNSNTVHQVRLGPTGILYGAVWNDYAEYRITKETIEPGRCVIETGDDDLVLSVKRMQPGAEIVSDTFGFAIGKTDEAKTPIASSGRVLAYPFEDIEEFRKNIGRPVCSGPNGTVSIMTDEEYQKYGYCAIGTISAIPAYEEWSNKNVKVNGRIWIRVR